ncbi:alpha-N-acetylgalactosaminide alpha-2,6-sialyltransferase 2-like isoform X2 [Rhinatrema bivittatum]|uniref:alpha-N-acetylgalactosaminide alpha-2,6-sialyltransferase 2-like isoform X2 n=1 Tax=Rhinatrema bivittatum TaxID=194408 RepID=UPI00112B9BF4|nr:alpha-N-acetylgalactosaminide alpha-2,6-sialyltransferase 2-like isoform X2 [Rhinatrema bivittatum]
MSLDKSLHPPLLKICPNSIRTRIAGTELQALILPTIPVLQWKKHATREEHERLRRYRGAQGWMEVEWDILNETLNLLNSSANGYMFDDWQQRHPANRSCICCAVVGNGGILNGSKIGAEIDQHDYVFRVNGAIVKGFEDDVGNRTSFYTFSTNTLRNSLAAYGQNGFKKPPHSQETRYIFLPDHDRDYLLVRAALTHTQVDRGHDKSARPTDYFGQNLRTEKVKMLHPDFMRYLRNRLLFSSIMYTKSENIYRASTGAAMLLAAVHTCDETCPNSIRTRIAGTELQALILPTIPVLQWKKHATREEHKRLRRYRGAQGWMQVKWDILNETLNLLNSSANGYMFDDWKQRHPTNRSCIRCAVVGNGGILNGSKIGAEIDQHDYVFRVNGAIVKGFEDDVGNRTSFYTFSTNTLMNSLDAYGQNGFKKPPQSQETRYIFLPDHDRDYLLVRAALTHTQVDRGQDKSTRPTDYFGQNLRTEKVKMLHPDFMRYLRNRLLFSSILYSNSKDIYRASTGAAMLLAAVHTCDEVSAYGFITHDYDKYSEHYYDKTYRNFSFVLNHNFNLEMELWQKLHKNGIIKLYSRQ